MKYYISDLHFFDDSMRRFDPRPFQDLDEMHQTMKDRWNHKVTNGDIVYILGDISMRGKKEELISLVATLKGKKILVKGNHDDLSDYRYQQLFSEICDYKEITDSHDGKSHNLVLCHYPIFSWKRMTNGTILLYGHTHNSAEDIVYQRCLSELPKNECSYLHKLVPQAINVGCMKPWMDYEPRTLKEILEYADRSEDERNR